MMMKKAGKLLWVLALGLTFLATGQAQADDSEVRIDKVPTTTQEFVELRNRIATTPHGGAAIMVLAILAYSENQKTGQDFLTIAIDGAYLTDKADGYQGKAPLARYMQNFKMRIADRPYVARSYIQGTSPDNGYTIGPLPLVIKIKQQSNDVNDSAARLFIYSTGADTPRPLRLKKNDKGLWKASEWSSLELGVRPPKKVVNDDI